MIFNVQGDVLKIVFEQSLYSEEVIFKCFYWYSGKFSVQVNHLNGSFEVTLQSKMNSDINWDKIIPKIKQDILDYKLRAIVLKETATIRELIVAKAFAYYQEPEAPATHVSDPVGFDPDQIKLYE